MPATSIIVIDEVLHFIIRKEAISKYSVRRAYDLRRLVRGGGVAFVKESLSCSSRY